MKRPLNSIQDRKAWVAKRPPLSREEQKARQRACERDEELAAMLVWPEEQWDENGIPHYNFLSPDAEKEAYAALSRVLHPLSVGRLGLAHKRPGCISPGVRPDRGEPNTGLPATLLTATTKSPAG